VYSSKQAEFGERLFIKQSREMFRGHQTRPVYVHCTVSQKRDPDIIDCNFGKD